MNWLRRLFRRPVVLSIEVTVDDVLKHMHVPDERVYVEVMAERSRANMKHGGPAVDDTRSPDDWCRYIDKQLKAAYYRNNGTWRSRMVKIAGLALAAIEAHDRVYGYDGE